MAELVHVKFEQGRDVHVVEEMCMPTRDMKEGVVLAYQLFFQVLRMVGNVFLFLQIK